MGLFLAEAPAALTNKSARQYPGLSEPDHFLKKTFDFLESYIHNHNVFHHRRLYCDDDKLSRNNLGVFFSPDSSPGHFYIKKPAEAGIFIIFPE